MNENINNALNDYIAIENPQYAVMLTGKWGCGKTYFIKKWIESQTKSSNQNDTVWLNPIYVSLYGLSSIADINKAIDRELNPFFYSRIGKLVDGFVKIASKALIKSEITLNEDDKYQATFSFDSLALLRNKNELFSGKKILVFDDLERCLIDKKILLGLINYLVEHSGCHVVLICDENNFSEKDKEVINELLEKTIGREFEINSDVKSALQSFFNSYPHCAPIVAEKEWIITCFNYTGYGNLRILKQCLFDLNCQIAKIEKPDNVYSHQSFFKNFLASFIVIYAELGQKEYTQLLKEWHDEFNFTLYIDQNEKSINPVREIYDKYAGLAMLCRDNPLNPTMVKHIVDYHTKGIDCKDYIEQCINISQEECTVLEQLQNFRNLDNQVFKQAGDKGLLLLSTPQIEDAFAYGELISYYFFFNKKEIRTLTSKDLQVIEDCGIKLIENCQNLNQTYKCYKHFMDGLGSFFAADYNNTTSYDVILTKWRNKYDVHFKKFPDKMQEELRKLSDENVELLDKIDQENYVDNSKDYHFKAIFVNEDANRIFDLLEKMSNAGRTKFISFLSYHYRDAKSFKDIYKNDLSFLKSFKSLALRKISCTELVERYSYHCLNSVLKKVLEMIEVSDT